MTSKWRSCKRCPELVDCRKKVVLGYGNPNANIMFIADKPGFEENKEGIPMLGAVGDYYNTTLVKAGISFEDVWTTNAVACLTPKARDPFDYELNNCLERLREEILSVDPDIIVLMGRVTFRHLTGQTAAVSKSQLKTFVLEFEHEGIVAKYPAIVTYNPGFIRKNPSLKTHQPWHFMYRAFQRAVDVTDRLIEVRDE